MSEVVWASQMLKGRVAPPGSAASKGERIRAAARQLKWKFSRARDVWYADQRVSLKPAELRKIEEITGVKYGRQEARELDHLIGRADALLGRSDADQAGAIAHALRALIRALDRSRAD